MTEVDQAGAQPARQAGPAVAIGVLAGERPGPSEIAAAEGVALKVLVDIDGLPMLRRVLEVAGEGAARAPVLVCGPEALLCAAEPWLESHTDSGALAWVPSAPSPSRSARAIVEAGLATGAEAVLVTTGDHPLLTAATLRRFAADALATGADAVAGLASYEAVRAAFPHSRRTALKFADGHRCGCNLFLFRGVRAARVLDFWQTVEGYRKQPQKILGLLGPGLVVRYVAGRLTLSHALERLSVVAGAQVRVVAIDDPDAAVDVDNLEDLATVRARWQVRTQAPRGNSKA